jgi:hypothetical protein
VKRVAIGIRGALPGAEEFDCNADDPLS